ncbi:MAG: DUF1015 family protein [Actinomycetota bacterium]|nr:DUF1015 family protein [Actinomycetota bacterium]
MTLVIQTIRASIVDPNWAPSVVPPPYDSLSVEERREHLTQHPNSFLHVTRSADASHGHPTEHRRLAVEGDSALTRLISEGAYTEPNEPSLFLQKIESQGITQRSIIGAIKLDEQVLHAHEGVHPGRVRALTAHFSQVRSMSSPVAVTSREQSIDLRSLEASDNASLIRDFSAIDGTQITLWKVSADLSVVSPPLYIIDGHHRVAAAGEARLERLLVAYVPPAELHLGSFDRDLDELVVLPRRVVDRLSKWCDVTEVGSQDLAQPTERGELGFGFGDKWFQARRRDLNGLDAEFLHGTLLPELFDVHAPDDPRLSYRSATTRRRTDPVTIRMAPAELEDVFGAADSGRVMPPKSTNFLPKARSGVLIVSC